MQPKVIIVGTVPYNKNMQSRAFDAYFHYWEKSRIQQVFSNSSIPTKGHCCSFYQITDARMLKRWFSKKIKTGIIYDDEELLDENNSKFIPAKKKSILYKFGSRHTPFTHLLRKYLWRKKYWCTTEFDEWLTKFSPDCVFLSFSYDFFINEIALYISNKFNIPIVSSIGDDYYFNNKFSLNPFYLMYRRKYKRLIDKILYNNNYAIYISDKIKLKYNNYFNLRGETIYLNSGLVRKEFKVINVDNPIITYFGNIRMGRNYSLKDIAEALKKINTDYKLEVYSNESEDKYIEPLKKTSNIIYNGSIPYEKVKQRMLESDITIIVEGFKEKDINWSRYSLSTKAADTLSSGVQIFTYGSSECGIVEYMKSTKASMVCESKEYLVKDLTNLLNDNGIQSNYYSEQIIVYNENHLLENNCKKCEKVFLKAVEENRK